MPKNVMKLLKPSRNVGRNDFDLSHRHLMTANFGELLPITCIETVPGDYVEMRISDLLRACPMVTSPFMRVKQHIDVWFTPYDYMWHNFESFITLKEDPASSSLKGFDYCPCVTKDTLAYWANQQQGVDFKDVVGSNYFTGSRKLLDFLGYGQPLKVSTGSTDTSPRVNIWRLLQYNKIWYDEYRQKYYDDGKRLLSATQGYSSPAFLYSVDDLQCDSVAHSTLPNDSRIMAMCQMRYRLWKKDLYTGILPSSQFGAVSAVPFTGNVPVNITGSATLSGSSGTDLNKHVFVDNSGNAVDSSYLTPDNNERYVFGIPNAGLDRSNSSYGNVFLMDATRTDHPEGGYAIDEILGRKVGNNTIRDVHTHSLSGSASVSASGIAGLTGNAFDILALRKAEALQIWRENALRAGNRISDNMRAHYGDDAEYDDHRSTLLGSVDAPLNIGDIDSHSQTGSGANQQLGDVAGKGLSSLNEKVFKFKAKKFGCIMVMFSILPEAEYESQGVDRMNQLLEREDYFQSEFQNCGLEAVSVNTLYYWAHGSQPFGFAPAYVGYKTKLDKCFEQFYSNMPFAPWASPKIDVPAYVEQQATNFLIPLATLYINPQLFNRNFGVAVTGTPGAEATSEQVICDFYFDVSAVRAMSVVGLPQNT